MGAGPPQAPIPLAADAARSLPFAVMTRLPPVPARLLVVDRDRDAIAALIAARRPRLEIACLDRRALTPAHLAWADAYLGFRPPDHLPFEGPSWVHCTGAGVDGFLFRRPFPPEALLTRTGEPFGTQIGEWCLARALAECQALLPLADAQRRREWAPIAVRALRGLRVLVVGTGEVGRGVAQAFLGAGCVVHGASRSGAARSPFVTVRRVDHLAEGFAEAEIIALALPLTEETWHLVTAALLGHCRGALLLNAGRGAVVDEAALLPALEAGHLAAAALDVFEEEPLPASSPLWHDPRVRISPHQAGLTSPAGAAEGFLDVYAALERGEHPVLAVDPRRGY